MYLGVVSSIVKKEDYREISNKAMVNLCDGSNNLIEIAVENTNNLELGNLLFVKLGENGKYNFEKIDIPFSIKYYKLDEKFLFQLFNLIDKEKERFEIDKDKFQQLAKGISLKNLNTDTLIDIVNIFSNRKRVIELMCNRFKCSVDYIEMDLNDVKKYMEIQCMKIITETQFYDSSFKEWLNNVTLLLCFSNTNDIDEELLVRTIKILLSVKIKDNETNELKLQLEQQLKQKLNELKGKQKKLV